MQAHAQHGLQAPDWRVVIPLTVLNDALWGEAVKRFEDRDGQYIRDEEDLERAGGVTADDRVEVQPWLAAEGRFSFVSSDPRAIDLACFASLKR